MYYIYDLTTNEVRRYELYDLTNEESISHDVSPVTVVDNPNHRGRQDNPIDLTIEGENNEVRIPVVDSNGRPSYILLTSLPDIMDGLDDGVNTPITQPFTPLDEPPYDDFMLPRSLLGVFDAVALHEERALAAGLRYYGHPRDIDVTSFPPFLNMDYMYMDCPSFTEVWGGVYFGDFLESHMARYHTFLLRQHIQSCRRGMPKAAKTA